MYVLMPTLEARWQIPERAVGGTTRRLLRVLVTSLLQGSLKNN